MLKRYQIKNYRFILIICIVALSILGILLIGSAKASLQGKQIIGLLFGLFVLVVVSLLDYSSILNYYWLLYALNIFLLVLVRLFGVEVNNAKRWIVIGFQFQPSELGKILLILFFAQYIMKHKEDLNTFKTLFKIVLFFLPPFLLILKQPNLSTSMLVFVVFCVIVYMGGLSYKIIGSILAIVIPLCVILLSIVLQPDQKIIEPYQQTRILAFIQPEKYENSDYQQSNSVMAIGSGQLIGKGLDNNVVGSVKNGNFIVEPETDFIYAIAGEELGFIGGCVIITLLAFVVFICLWIGKNAKDLAGSLICYGMAALIGFQSFINIGVATRVLPNTGVPLPFVSYGLTSLVSLFIGMGFVLNVGLQPKKY